MEGGGGVRTLIFLILIFFFSPECFARKKKISNTCCIRKLSFIDCGIPSAALLGTNWNLVTAAAAAIFQHNISSIVIITMTTNNSKPLQTVPSHPTNLSLSGSSSIPTWPISRSQLRLRYRYPPSS